MSCWTRTLWVALLLGSAAEGSCFKLLATHRKSPFGANSTPPPSLAASNTCDTVADLDTGTIVAGAESAWVCVRGGAPVCLQCSLSFVAVFICSRL